MLIVFLHVELPSIPRFFRRRYEVTEEGLHLALFVSRVEPCVCRDGLVEVFSPDEGSGCLRQRLNSFGREVEKLMSRHLALPS